jgi:hypothetical protein
LSLGITPTKLLYADRIFGFEGSRAEAFSSLLHNKKIMRLTWGEKVQTRDVLSFASVLSTSKRTSSQLRDQLELEGVYSIGIDPLDVSKIHGALSWGSSDVPSPDGAPSPGLEAWLWLQDDSIQPPKLAEALCSDELWKLAKKNPSFPVMLLLQHGRKLDQAFALLNEEERERARQCILDTGKALPVADLASIVLSELKTDGGGGDGLTTLLDGLDMEGLIDLMAGVVALSGSTSSRVTAVFKALAPRCDADQMLSLIDQRLSQGVGQSYAADVWRSLKTFLLDLEEGAFFGDNYLLDLERMSLDAPEGNTSERGSEFSTDPEPHLDWMHYAMAVADGGDAVVRLRRRVAARLPVVPVSELLQLADAISKSIPSFFAEQRESAQEVFARVISEIRILDTHERKNAIAFAQAYESTVLDQVLARLIAERRIAARRFLVAVLSAMSAETTVAMVSRACDAPWYYVRNVATVLGRRQEKESGPILQALLRHPHEKVRKEALKALGNLRGAATNVLEEFAADVVNRADERALAGRILTHKKAEP